ncbi:MAG: hypothetical protein ACFB11_19910 [Paracoccaceae bacterium]
MGNDFWCDQPDPKKRALVLPDTEAKVAPTHWSFGLLAGRVGALASYLRRLPAPLVGINLQCEVAKHPAEYVKTKEVANGRTELRAVTAPIMSAPTTRNWFLPRRASQSNGTGHMRWKVSGMLDWSADLNNPMAHITEDTVTLSLGPEMSYLSRSMR